MRVSAVSYSSFLLALGDGVADCWINKKADANVRVSAVLLLSLTESQSFGLSLYSCDQISGANGQCL